MKKVLLLLIAFSFQQYPLAQGSYSDDYKYKAVYQLSFQPDSTDASSATSEEMWLYLGDQSAKFSSRGKALKDSLLSTSSMGMANFQAMAEQTRTEFQYILLKNFPEGKLSYTLDKINNKLLYEEDKDLFTWEILPETKTIRGYESQKARTDFRGREYTAWFTTEIPISEGPYKFNGLPGLILDLKDSREHYVFELVQFIKLKDPVSFSMDTGDYTLTTKDELLRIVRQIDEDPFAALENANKGSTRKVTIEISKQQKREHLKKIREELERKNNPIELK